MNSVRVLLGLNDGSEIWTVTNYVLNVSVNLGKNRVLDSFQPGTASVTFKNMGREFDPTNTGSAFYGSVLPRATWVFIEIPTLNTIFEGWVDDWSFDYDVSGESTAILIATERTGLFARQYITSTSFPAETSGDRFVRVLQDSGVAYSNPYNVTPYVVADGTQMLAADTQCVGKNALDYINSIEVSEQGSLYTNSAGQLVFTDASYGPTSDVFLASRLFTDDGTANAYKYVDIDISYSSDMLYNKVVAEAFDGSQSSVGNSATSQSTYNISQFNVDEVLYNVPSQLSNLCNFLLAKYSEPEYRINNLTVNFRDLTSTQQDNLLDFLGLNSFCRVKFTPNGVGSAIERVCRIIGIEHQIDVAEHLITFSFESLRSAGLVLDDAEFGKLDTYALGL
jgi:hypothetical protein